MSSNVPSPRLRYRRFFEPSRLFVTYRSGRPSASTSTTDTAAPIEATCGMMCASFASSVGASWTKSMPAAFGRLRQPEPVPATCGSPPSRPPARAARSGASGTAWRAARRKRARESVGRSVSSSGSLWRVGARRAPRPASRSACGTPRSPSGAAGRPDRPRAGPAARSYARGRVRRQRQHGAGERGVEVAVLLPAVGDHDEVANGAGAGGRAPGNRSCSSSPAFMIT